MYHSSAAAPGGTVSVRSLTVSLTISVWPSALSDMPPCSRLSWGSLLPSRSLETWLPLVQSGPPATQTAAVQDGSPGCPQSFGAGAATLSVATSQVATLSMSLVSTQTSGAPSPET